MGALIRVADVAPQQVRVELRCGDIGVPEQLLDHAKVGAAIKEVRRKRVPQRVRVNLPAKTGGARGASDRRPRRLTAQASATTRKQECRWLRGCAAASSHSPRMRRASSD